MQRITRTILISVVAAQLAPAQDTQNVSAGLTGAGAPLAIHGYDPVAYFTTGLPTRGSAKFTSVHDDAAYRFVSEANKTAFERTPSRFAPQFGGFCAFGVTVEQKFDGDPRVFEIVNDKLYFNLNPDIQAMWRKDIPGNLEKASRQWTKIHATAAPKL